MDEKKKYLMQHTLLMHQLLVEQKGHTDVLDWLVLGKHYSKNGDEEIAFQCYQMAHMLEHTKIRTNSELAFTTIEIK